MQRIEQETRVLAGRYEVGPLTLGGGGMGAVLEGCDQVLQRPVAVKILAAGLAADENIRRRFEHEALAAARLHHPNVVQVFDVGLDGGTPFIVMERLSGRSLADVVAQGPLPQAEVARIGAGLLRALAHAHAEGVIHRDVKPGNILLDDQGEPRVADFGIAKSIGIDLTRTRELFGTPSYLAPEILTGSPATPATDVYAAGVTLAELLTGRRPFEGDTPWAVLGAIQRGERPPLRELAPDADTRLLAIIERAMAPDPSARTGSAAAMADELAEIASNLTVATGNLPTSASDSTLDTARPLSPSEGPVVAPRTMRLVEDPPTVRTVSQPAAAVAAPDWFGRAELLLVAIAALVAVVALIFLPDDPALAPAAERPGPAASAVTLEEALADLDDAVGRR